MKTSVEISGYTISIEETDGVISVNAVKDDEVVEEFTIEVEEGDEFAQGGEEGEDHDDVRPFGEFDEEEDFGGSQEDEEFDQDEEDMPHSEEGEEDEEDEDEDDSEDEEEEGKALESFQSFINKKRK